MNINFIINRIKLENKIYSDAELARVLNVTPSAISNWKARKNVPVSVIKKYCFNNNKDIKNYLEGSEFLDVKIKQNTKIKGKNMLGGELIESQKDLIEYQRADIKQKEKEINELKSILSKKEKQTMSNPIWEELDYDVLTTQVYETDSYAFFESYEIIRHLTFFAKLGYNRYEADIKYEELKRFVDAKGTPQNNNKINWLFIKNKTDDNILEWKKTKDFFLASKKKNMINALEMFKVTYKHKNGSGIPAIINVLYDFKGDSSISKIKFITD
jgi:transcriptional regulator with XRE-family HTH domain